MASKSGGAWKVAYADFVTAMMAFFLVMWIAGQDQKIKQAVARYFVNPMSIESLGASKKPDRMGAIFEIPSAGSVPKSESVAVGKGRNSHTSRGVNSPATKLVNDWLHADEEETKYWREQAQRARASAKQTKEVRNKRSSVDEVAALLLSKQLKDEITRRIATQAQGLTKDLLMTAFLEVNWTELAEDLIAH